LLQFAAIYIFVVLFSLIETMLWHKSYPRLTTGGAACWQASSGKRF